VSGDLRAFSHMYHVELRQFPHNFCRFNLTERELRETILDAWAQGEWIELGERKWSPHQANLTVLEGPQLPVDQLSLGRGWRNAGRQGRDVTEQLLATTRAAASNPAEARAGAVASSFGDAAEQQSPTGRGVASDTATSIDSARDVRLVADSLGLEVLARLGAEPLPIAIVWQLARERYPERSASDCLELAEHAIRSLAQARLAVVLAMRGDGDPEPCASGEQVERVLHAIDSWTSTGGSVPALIRRA
jgi:hypothetical protein